VHARGSQLSTQVATLASKVATAPSVYNTSTVDALLADLCGMAVVRSTELHWDCDQVDLSLANASSTATVTAAQRLQHMLSCGYTQLWL
jgi:hypothetical protein